MANPPTGMLSGVRILSFTQFLLGPAGVQYLGDLGAEIIKIEPPGGPYERFWSGGDTFPGGVSAFFLLAHRNVRSLTLNLKSPQGQAIARKLVEGADVLVQNFRPGVMERFGLGYEEMKKINPGLIYASASGYGMDSPYRDLPGQDLLLQALAGLAYATGKESDPPVPTGSAIVDQHGASLLAMGILAALFHKQRTGEGQSVEVTMVQSALDLQLEPLVYYMNGGKVSRPTAPLASAFHQAPYGFYATKDGYMALSLSPIRSFSEAMGNPPELAPYLDHAVVYDQRNEIQRALAPLMKQRTTEEWMGIFRARGIWAAPANDYAAVLRDPVVQYLEPFQEMDHPQAGKVRVLKHPIRYGAADTSMRRLPPELGQDTQAILEGAGYSVEEIEKFRIEGAI